ncbi:MAG: ABC transporter substrate-binding protein [Pleurocapsa sp.]
MGEKILVDSRPDNLKQAAASDLAKGNYQQAISRLETILKKQRNDPESLIYLNNARITNKPAYFVAVPVPIESEIDVAQEILRGVAQAQDEINRAGGIDGKLLKIIIANDRNSQKTGQELATTFSQEPDILGVIGHFSSDVTLAAAEIYQKNGLVVISPTSTSVALSYAGSYIFRTVSSDCLTGNTLAEYLVDNLKLRQVALFYNSANSYSNSLREVFRTKLQKKNGAVVAEFNFNQPNFDIVDALQETTAADAEALILFPNSSGFNAIETIDKTLLILQRNAGKLPILGGDSLYKPRILQLAQENAVGMIIAVPWHSETTEAQFTQNATRLWGGTGNWRTALSYDATMALAKAIENAPSRQGVQQILSSQNFTANGASGLIRFLANGDRDTEVELVKVTVGSNSGFGYDFVPIANTATSSVDACQVQN